MGNTKSTSCSNKTSIQEEDLRLNDYDMTIYEYRKERIFKGTIAVCIIYAFIALLILVSSYLIPTIKFVIFEKFLPFTIVFIVGTILLIIYLFYNILNFNPIKINKNYDYTNISCPDYWTLEYKPDLQKYFDSNTINPNIFNYRCVLNNNLFSKTDLYFNKKRQNGNLDSASDENIGITGYTNNFISSYPGLGKDEIDSSNNKYLVANIKGSKNKEIINKIAGNYDSNIYKNIVESSLLMNNYFFDSSNSINNDFNIYKHISQADINNNFDTKLRGDFLDNNNELNIRLVESDMNTSGSASYLTDSTEIKFKKNLTGATEAGGEYLKHIKTGSGEGTEIQNIPLVCNRVYPLLLAAKDKELSRNSSGKYDENVLRCAYSKMCGVPWSDMNCDKYET